MSHERTPNGKSNHHAGSDTVMNPVHNTATRNRRLLRRLLVGSGACHARIAQTTKARTSKYASVSWIETMVSAAEFVVL